MTAISTIEIPVQLRSDAVVARQPVQRPFIALALVFAAVLLGGVILINDGALHWRGLQWLTVALLALSGGLILCRTGLARLASPGMLERVLILAVAGQVLQLALVGTVTSVSSNLPRGGLCACLLAFDVGLLAAIGRRWRGGGLILMLASFAVAGWACIYTAPHVSIDVLMFQRESSTALLNRHNPYTVRYPDLYEAAPQFYGPGVAKDGWLTYSFPYPPMSLLLVAPGQLLGDVRYAHLAAMTLAGLLLSFTTRNRVGLLAAALLLTSPKTLHIIQTGWTEPLLCMLAAGTALCAARWRGGLWIALGLFLATKQYLVVLLPLLPLLRPALGRIGWWATVIGAAALAAATIVPFVVADPHAFWRGVVEWQLVQPFRRDAMTYTALLAAVTGKETGGGFGFAAAALAIGLSWWKAPRTAGGMFAAAAVVFTAFFAFNKQAFCNYYFFSIALCCCGIALLSLAPPVTRRAIASASAGN